LTNHYTAFHNPTLLQAIQKSTYFKEVIISDKDTPLALGLQSGNWLTQRTWFFDFQEERLKEILEKCSQTCKKDVYTEIRNFDNKNLNGELLKKNGFERKDWLNIIVNTQLPKEKLFENLHISKRRQVNRSLENGAKIEIAQKEEDVYEFYKILRKVYKRRVKKPLPDWKFFQAFYHANKDKNYGFYLLVKYQGKVVAGMLCPITPNEILYEWFIAGLDKEMNSIGIYPSVLVTWAAIEYASQHKIKQFNFMGAGSPHDNYGVRDFKKQFGGEMMDVGRWVKVWSGWRWKAGEWYFLGKRKVGKGEGGKARK
jgi:serine/alanine adding enzyme